MLHDTLYSISAKPEPFSELLLHMTDNAAVESPSIDDSLAILETGSLLVALKKLERSTSTLTLVVVNGLAEVVGTLTDGDIRRGLIRIAEQSGASIDLAAMPVREAMHPNPITVNRDDDNDAWFKKIGDARDKIYSDGKKYPNRIRMIPVLDENKRLVDVLDLVLPKTRPSLDVLLMPRIPMDGSTPCSKDGCTSDAQVLARRQYYDTIRYRLHLDKLEALGKLVLHSGTETEAIIDARRADELYLALKMGQDWARDFRTPNESLQSRFLELDKTLDRASCELVLRYLFRSMDAPYVGNEDAYWNPEVVIVLGCKDKAEQDERVQTALAYLRELAEYECGLQWMILSGGGGDGISSEAQRMKEALESEIGSADLDLESDGNQLILRKRGKHIKILLEEDSMDTVGNAIFSRLTLRKAELESCSRPTGTAEPRVCVVTTDYHSLRTWDLFQRVFSPDPSTHAQDSKVCVKYHRQHFTFDELTARGRRAQSQLDSEARTNVEIFGLENPVTGVPQGITSGHIRSMFSQLLRHHQYYKHRIDLIRKYKEVLLAEDEFPADK